MTDLDYLASTLDSIGVEYEESKENGVRKITIDEWMKNVDAHVGFYCSYIFDNRGSFKTVEIKVR